MNRNFQIYEYFRESLLKYIGLYQFSSKGRISELDNCFMRRHLLGRFNYLTGVRKKKYREKNSTGYQRKRSAVIKISRPGHLRNAFQGDRSRYFIGRFNLSDWRQKKISSKRIRKISKKKSAVNKISRPGHLGNCLPS